MAGSLRPSKRAVILYSIFPEERADAQRDVIEYADTIGRAIAEMGFEPAPLGVSLDLNSLAQRIRDVQPAFVFNLVDEIDTRDQFLYFVPSLLEAFNIPFTGANARGHFLTTDKLLAKQMMQLRGMPTPPWRRCDESRASHAKFPMPCIVKRTDTDASHGIDDRSVCHTPAELAQKITLIPSDERARNFYEQFIDGREFNLSLIATGDGVWVLPPAEMTFVDYPPGKPAIVDFKAKWVPDSFEYNHTIRRFDFPEADTPLLDEIKRLALAAWSLFGLSGYARVDFRVDAAGRPWVLEVNANPCVAPDAGFIAAAAIAGMNFDQTIRMIVEDALRRSSAPRRSRKPARQPPSIPDPANMGSIKVS